MRTRRFDLTLKGQIEPECELNRIGEMDGLSLSVKQCYATLVW